MLMLMLTFANTKSVTNNNWCLLLLWFVDYEYCHSSMIFAIVKLVGTDPLHLSRSFSLGWSIQEWVSSEGFAMSVSQFSFHRVISGDYGLMTL